jgi:YVTN family beta-propeller protein
VACDGLNIWVANFFSQTMTKLATDGSVLGTYAVGDGPAGVTYAGSYIWVANNGSNTVSKVQVSDGALVKNFSVGRGPYGVVYDGANLWVASSSTGQVSKISPASTAQAVP